MKCFEQINETFLDGNIIKEKEPENKTYIISMRLLLTNCLVLMQFSMLKSPFIY